MNNSRSPFVIEANNLSKSYGSVKALDDVSLKVKASSIFALLGPNGAGKTTFVKTILGLVRGDSGDILINGTSSESEKSRHRVGFLPEKFSFYPYYTVEGTLQFYGKIQGLPAGELSKSIDEALNAVNISDLKKRKLKTLSKGQLQRTGIASLILGGNDLIVMDEPFSGLDPIGIKELKELLVKLKGTGKTIFLNSHILSEMEQICDEMALLNRGKCLVSGNIKELIGDQKLEDYFYEMVKKQEGGAL